MRFDYFSLWMPTSFKQCNNRKSARYFNCQKLIIYDDIRIMLGIHLSFYTIKLSYLISDQLNKPNQKL